MLVIRAAQNEKLAVTTMRAFEDRTYKHLQTYFPRHCLLLGEEQMRRVVQLGWQKAKSYDLTAECCVRSYIEFMCLLGSEFATDPLLPWAATILNDQVTLSQVERGDRLYDQVWDYVAHIAQDYRDTTGKPTTARFMDEIRNLRRKRDDVVTQNTYPNFARDLAWRIQSLFPAKCRYVGEHRVQSLFPRGVRLARSYGITSDRGITLLTVLMFVLGSGFTNDPLLPWAKATLNDRRIVTEIDRVDRLYAEGIGFLNRWWNSTPEKS
jgi:hypothetical protein